MQKCIYCGSETKEEWGDDGHGHCGSVFYCKNGCEPFDDFDVELASTEQANQPDSGEKEGRNASRI